MKHIPIALCIIFFGCEQTVKTREKEVFESHIVYADNALTVYKIKIDSSEYVIAKGMECVSMVKHK